ncbi:hypothetical protein [Nocardioides limicola]|uniref:hypothetical protein n=1 Tax=Nocardioides limicola TaxID=2803368 RepID=UPI00193C2D94|nr:hypothetical protein [Nocardioides sp. DJM-14]
MAVAVAVAVSACTADSAVDPEAGPSNDAPFVVTATGEVEVSCGGHGPGWAPSVMPEGVPGVLTDDEATGIFSDILDDPRTGEEAQLSLFGDGVDVEWRVLRDDGDTLTLGLGHWTEQGPTGAGDFLLDLERVDGSWRATGWGDCHLSPVLTEGAAWVEVTGVRSDPEGSTLTAQIHERECTSARDPEPFLHDPYLVETSDSVTLYWTSEPLNGAANCQGNPTVERVVELQEPLGSRVVYDGFHYPPREVPTN